MYSARGLAIAACILVGLIGLFRLVEAVSLVLLAMATMGAWDESMSLALATLITAPPFCMFYRLIKLVAAALFLVWVHQAAINVRALRAQKLRFPPSWAVGWWFVPVANYVQPYRAMQEIWRASGDAPSRQDLLLSAWWALWVTASILGLADWLLRGFFLDVPLGISFAILADELLYVAAAVLCILVVATLTARQNQRGDVAIMGTDFRHRRTLGICLSLWAFLIGPLNLYLLAFPRNYAVAIVGESLALVSLVCGILVWRRRRGGVYGAFALGVAGTLILLPLIVVVAATPGVIIWFDVSVTSFSGILSWFALQWLALQLTMSTVILGLALSSMFSDTWRAGAL